MVPGIIMGSQPTPTRNVHHPYDEGLWKPIGFPYVRPAIKPGYFWRGYVAPGGVGKLAMASLAIFQDEDYEPTATSSSLSKDDIKTMLLQ